MTVRITEVEPQKPWVCPLCEADYQKSKDLWDHLANRHPGFPGDR